MILEDQILWLRNLMLTLNSKVLRISLNQDTLALTENSRALHLSQICISKSSKTSTQIWTLIKAFTTRQMGKKLLNFSSKCKIRGLILNLCQLLHKWQVLVTKNTTLKVKTWGKGSSPILILETNKNKSQIKNNNFPTLFTLMTSLPTHV